MRDIEIIEILMILCFFCFWLVLPSISSYEIICQDNGSGLKIWDYTANLSENKTQKIALELLMETEEFENCTFIEEAESDCEIIMNPVISLLNSNILERNTEIERLKTYKIWMYIFMGILILFITPIIIREGWLWLKNR